MKKALLILTILVLSGIESSVIAQTPDDSARPEDNTNLDEIPTEIYVTGALSPIGLERLGKPVSIITHKELQERPESTVGELLSNEPGVSSTYFGPGASRPVIRGQSKQRVRMLENGLESGDVSDVSDDHAVSVDPLSVQRIDVLRGPGTLLYGSSAIGGVVNMIDASISEESTGTPLSAEADIRKGDNADNESSGAFSLNGESEYINWHFSSFYRETDDLQIPGFAESERLRESESNEEHEGEEEVKGKLENSDSLSKGFKIGGSHVWDKGYFGLALRALESDYGVPGEHHHSEDQHSDEEHSDEVGDPRIDMNQFRLEGRGEVRMDQGFFKAVRFGAAYSDYQHKELEGDQTATKFDKDSFETRVELTHSHDDGFEGGWGTQMRYDDFKSSGEEAFVPPSKTFSPALFAVEDYRINDWSVWQLGGRYEHSSVDPDELQSKSFNLFSASTGPVINLDDAEVYTSGLTFSYNQRAPTATELFSNGPHLATQSYEIGDAEMDIEKSTGAELVIRKNRGRLTGQTSLFWQHYSDYINLTQSGEELDDLPVYRYEMDSARFWGFEAETDYQLSPDNTAGFHLYNQIDYVRADNLSDNDPLPRITPLRGKIGLKYSYERMSTFVESMLVDQQDRTANFELPTDGYILLNAGAAYQLPIDDKNNYELYARATNLTDEEARVHNSFLKDVAPLRGRAFFVGFRYAF